MDKNDINDKVKNYAEISFKRLNIIPIISGLILISLAFVNSPYLLNEQGEFVFGITDPPGITLLAEINIYIVLGIIPIIFGSIFITFSFLTSRTITLEIAKRNAANSLEIIYKKSPVIKDFLGTEQNLISSNEIQQIIIGKRHQRFLSWAAFAFIFFLIYLLWDYINYMNISFDMWFISAGIPISTRWLLTINMILMFIAAVIIVLFPRKLFQLDTPEDLVKFDYKSFKIDGLSDESKGFPILQTIETALNPIQKSIVVDNLIKDKVGNIPKSHLPIFNLILCICYLLIVIFVQITPDFFLLDFTADIFYFITYNAAYFLVRIIHNSWFTEQSIRQDSNSIECLRRNPVSGTWVNYYEFESLDVEYRPFQPHYLEYFVIFFPLMELIWVIHNLLYFSAYFITNPYSILYIIMIIGIMVIVFLEYNTPDSVLTMKAKYQTRDSIEDKFYLAFPNSDVQGIPSFKLVLNSENFSKNYYKGILIILVPILFGVLWVLLSMIGILPALESTLF